MEDRYLYRAKRTDNGEWITWNILTGIPHDVSILGDTVCACTGLKDKNGKLIWENDIVRHYNNPSEPEQFKIGVIYWNEDNVRYERTSQYEHAKFSILYDCVYEVIGSLIDNPELLEVG